MAVVRWTILDVFAGGSPLTFTLNPNNATVPSFEKQLNIQSSSGPGGPAIIQEGKRSAPTMTFSGPILTKEHLDFLEGRYRQRRLLELEDDLGRRYQGVFSGLEITREFRPNNPWFHTYSASFVVYAYVNADGINIYGRPASA